MTREQQIEELGRVWESLHPGNRTDTGHCGHSFSFFSNCHPASAKDIKQVAEFFSFGTDTDDATPCLAILRDVYGEDVDIVHTRHDLTHYWRVRTLQGYDVGVHGAHSTLSRIHAVTLALEERS